MDPLHRNDLFGPHQPVQHAKLGTGHILVLLKGARARVKFGRSVCIVPLERLTPLQPPTGEALRKLLAKMNAIDTAAVKDVKRASHAGVPRRVDRGGGSMERNRGRH